MARARLRRKKKESVMTVGGKIITVFFIVFLIGGGYFLFQMFRPIEINAINMTGEWQLKDSTTSSTYWYFEANGLDDMSGTASHYTKQTGTGVVQDKIEYSFTMEYNENGVMVMTMTAPREKDVVMKITSLSTAQMGIIHDGSQVDSMTKTNIF